jgi:hypothetical protein
VRRARRGGPLHPDVGAPRDLLAAALDFRLGYLLGAPDLTAADVGAGVLQALPQGPTTRAALHRTLAGFLGEHAGRSAALAPGVVLDQTRERALASDAIVLALLGQAAGDAPLARLALAGPAATGLDDERLRALVDPRVESEVVRLTGAADASLWRPLATRHVERAGPGWWRIGEIEVVVDLAVGRFGGTSATDRLTHGRPGATWVARYERLVRHPSTSTADRHTSDNTTRRG